MCNVDKNVEFILEDIFSQYLAIIQLSESIHLNNKNDRCKASYICRNGADPRKCIGAHIKPGFKNYAEMRPKT